MSKKIGFFFLFIVLFLGFPKEVAANSYVIELEPGVTATYKGMRISPGEMGPEFIFESNKKEVLKLTTGEGILEMVDINGIKLNYVSSYSVNGKEARGEIEIPANTPIIIVCWAWKPNDNYKPTKIYREFSFILGGKYIEFTDLPSNVFGTNK